MKYHISVIVKKKIVPQYLVLVILLITKTILIGQKDVLVVLAHPDFERSEVNKGFISKLERMDQVTIDNLYEKYSDFDIDVEKEQSLLEEHDIIIFQFPLYWFGSPALLRKWQNDVVTSAFAFGENNRMKGKQLMIVTSVGGTQEDYRHGGSLDITMDEILVPFKSFAHFIEMKYLTPFIIYDVPNPKILNIPMTEDESTLRAQHIESKGEELVNLILSLQRNHN